MANAIEGTTRHSSNFESPFCRRWIKYFRPEEQSELFRRMNFVTNTRTQSRYPHPHVHIHEHMYDSFTQAHGYVRPLTYRSFLFLHRPRLERNEIRSRVLGATRRECEDNRSQLRCDSSRDPFDYRFRNRLPLLSFLRDSLNTHSIVQ